MWQTWLVMSAARRVICRRIAQTRNKEEETRGRVVVAWIIELNYAAVSSLLDGILAPTQHVKSLQQPESCENRLEVSRRLEAESIALLKGRLFSRHFGIKQLCSWDNRWSRAESSSRSVLGQRIQAKQYLESVHLENYMDGATLIGQGSIAI